MTLPTRIPGLMHLSLRLLGALAVMTALWGCRPASSTETQPSPVQPSAILPSPSATVTPAPTPTPSPSPAVLFFWTKQETEAEEVSVIQRWWAERNAGIVGVLNTGPEVDTALQSTHVRAVLVASDIPLGQVVERARAYPQVSFLAVGRWPEQEPPPRNLTVLDPTASGPEYRAFIAGYLSTLLSPNWRGVMVAPASDMETLQAKAFVSGGRYYCGLCRPPKPPLLSYPRLQPVLSGEEAISWQQACEKAAREDDAETVYLVNAPTSVVSCFRQWGITVLWDGPPPENADISLALRAMTWTEILEAYGGYLGEEEGGQVISLPLHFDVRDAEFLAEHQGKLAKAREVWEELAQGWIALPED